MLFVGGGVLVVVVVGECYNVCSVSVVSNMLFMGVMRWCGCRYWWVLLVRVDMLWCSFVLCVINCCLMSRMWVLMLMLLLVLMGGGLSGNGVFIGVIFDWGFGGLGLWVGC